MRWMLDENWKLLGLPLSCTDAGEAEAELEKGRAYGCRLPCDIHLPLMEAGVIRDPVTADWCNEAEWTERRSWWFFRDFRTDEEMRKAERTVLTLERLDTNAAVYLNGSLIGTSQSVHLPFRRDISPCLRAGKNRLVIRVTTGLETVSERDLAEINWAVSDESANGYPDRGDTRRAFVRRPQYSTGWDWCPRIPTCGVTGHAWIETETGLVVRSARAETQSLGPTARVTVAVCVESLSLYGTTDGTLCVRLEKDGETVASVRKADLLLRAGYNYFTLPVDVENPALWFPNGMGDHPLYTVYVSVEWQEGGTEFPPFRMGIRTVELDTSRRRDGTRNFRFRINGKPCFCKGANWIPCDSLYVRADPARKEFFVRSAAQAGMNLLRIWGGGLYEDEEFYDACDRNGILIWQDFMHACAALPENRPDFAALCAQEYDTWTERLRNHPCMALFCGNNENASNFNPEENPHWGLPFSQTRQFGYGLSNRTAAEAVERNCPSVPYWNSSPFGGRLPSDGTCGDVHQWDACMMHPDMAVRTDLFAYDRLPGAFISEYGYPGPPVMESVREYCGPGGIDRGSRIWRIHTNTFEKDTVAAGIRRHYREPEGLSLEEYLLYAGMVQSLMLSYSLQSFRFRETCGGGLFWMYDDSWGEIGWSVIDYYRRPKIAYYGVRRAFLPRLAILRRNADTVTVRIANDTCKALCGTARIGYLSADGRESRLEPVSFAVPACSRESVCMYSLRSHGVTDADLTAGVLVFLPDGEDLPPAYLPAKEWRRMALPEPVFDAVCTDEGEDLLVTFAAQTFVHGVFSREIPAEPETIAAEDLYFDLLPGQKRSVRIRRAAGTRPHFEAVRSEPAGAEGGGL